jgi:2-C-methyl-D-erythritol 4-phosphate cytidylyltransferase/2-C-methyl-D-erythritol 2,4-cyclodiphosphate synthase
VRVGIGIDIHQFDETKPLWLGCILWPDQVGLDGHSDADVIAHAICDALLSAAHLGDLGSNFGVDKPEYKDASGELLLMETFELISDAGFRVENVAVQLIGNQPKISQRRAEMETIISKHLGGAIINISGTTSDSLGFTGRGEGLAAIATRLLMTI